MTDMNIMGSTGNTSEVDLDTLSLAMTRSLLPTIVYILLLMVVGLVGNCVVFLVYYRKFKPSSTRTYVLAMSVCDMLSNCLSLPTEVVDIRYSFTFPSPALCRFIRLTNSFLTLTSGFVLVAVARDRYRKMCRPLDPYRSPTRIAVYVLLCCLASLALSVVFAVLNGSSTMPTGVGNVTGVTCSVDDAYVETLFPLVYNLLMAVTFLTSVTIMAVSYIRIAIKLWEHKKRKKLLQKSEKISSSFSPSTPVSVARRLMQKDSSVEMEDPSSRLQSDMEGTSSGVGGGREGGEGEAKSVTSVMDKGRKNTGMSPASLSSGQCSSRLGRGKSPTAPRDRHVELVAVSKPQSSDPHLSQDSDEGCCSACSGDISCISTDVEKADLTGCVPIHQRVLGPGSLLSVSGDKTGNPCRELNPPGPVASGVLNVKAIHIGSVCTHHHTGTGSLPSVAEREAENRCKNFDRYGPEASGEISDRSDMEMAGEKPLTGLNQEGSTTGPFVKEGDGHYITEEEAKKAGAEAGAEGAAATAVEAEAEEGEGDITRGKGERVKKSHHPDCTAQQTGDPGDDHKSVQQPPQRKAFPSWKMRVLALGQHSQSDAQKNAHNHKKPSALPRTVSDRQNDTQNLANKREQLSSRPRHSKTRKKTGIIKSIPSSTTFMMFVLTAIFVINYLPHLVIISARAVDDSFGKGLQGALLNVYNTALRSYFINSAANSLVYGFCSPRFRQECRHLFCLRRQR